MKNLAILKIIGGGYSPESKPKGGAHWAECFSAFSGISEKRRSEAV